MAFLIDISEISSYFSYQIEKLSQHICNSLKKTGIFFGGLEKLFLNLQVSKGNKLLAEVLPDDLFKIPLYIIICIGRKIRTQEIK